MATNPPNRKFTKAELKKFNNAKKASDGERIAQRAEGKTPKQGPRIFKFGKNGRR